MIMMMTGMTVMVMMKTITVMMKTITINVLTLDEWEIPRDRVVINRL